MLLPVANCNKKDLHVNNLLVRLYINNHIVNCQDVDLLK